MKKREIERESGIDEKPTRRAHRKISYCRWPFVKLTDFSVHFSAGSVSKRTNETHLCCCRLFAVCFFLHFLHSLVTQTTFST